MSTPRQKLTHQSSSYSGSPSSIPVRPTPSSALSDSGSSLTDSRKRQHKKDDAIRLKMERDLGKKSKASNKVKTQKKAAAGTVLALKPSPALQIRSTTLVAEAAQLMAARREDCVLVIDEDDRIAGIFTAKDLAFRVIGQGIQARDVLVEQIMTKNPMCARTDTSATEALDLMVRKGFRHLPVMDENQDIAGILDITKCFYEAMEKLERAYATSRKLYDALEGVQSELGSSQPAQIIQYVETLRQKMAGPDLASVLDGRAPVMVSVRTSVLQAAALMRENHTTAVLVTDQNNITGIFTSKDVVLRVIAPGLDPAKCSVVRVMTPHPDVAPMSMSIQAALRKMHDGHYLNLPVLDADGQVGGMVDVLKLTYATLEQINSMSTEDSEGPAWNRFWLSVDNDSESAVSEVASHTQSQAQRTGTPSNDRSERHMRPPSPPRMDNVLPADSASHLDESSPTAASPAIEDTTFVFKFKAPSGKVHRLQSVLRNGLLSLRESISAKLGPEVQEISGHSGFAMSFVDDEGDIVSITTDQDLIDAVEIARRNSRDKVDLFLHHPDKAAIPRTLAPQNTAALEKRDDSSNAATVGKKPTTTAEQHVPGIPNELLLPGAVAALAVVIVLVFTFGRK